VSSEEDFLSRLRSAALRARASGFDGTAAAIEDILREEIERRAGAAQPADERGTPRPDLKPDP